MTSRRMADLSDVPAEWHILPTILCDYFKVRRVLAADLGELIELRRRVLATLTKPDVYVREDNEVEFLMDHLGGCGETIGLYLPGDGPTKLIAYAMVGFPRADDPHNIGRTIGLGPDELGKVGSIASCMVDPEWRGRGLQFELLRLRQIMCIAHGRRIYLSMVSLHNDASRHNMLKIGMAIRWVGVLEDYGLRRQILFADYVQPVRFDTGGVEYADRLDFDRQIALSSAGWWGVGDKKNPETDSSTIEFRRPVNVSAALVNCDPSASGAKRMS